MTMQQRLLRLAPVQSKSLDRLQGTRGDIYYDGTNQTLRVFDGQVKGGHELLRADFSNFKGTLPSTSIQNGYITIGHTVVDLGRAVTSLEGLNQVQAFNFIGNTNGNHYGDVVGNVTGDVTGIVTGNLIGNADTAGVATEARSVRGAINGSITSPGNGSWFVQSGFDNTPDENTILLSAGDYTNFPRSTAEVKGSQVSLTSYKQVSGTIYTTELSVSGTSQTITLSGNTVIGGAGLTTNVYGTATFDSTISGSITGNAGTVTHGVYDNQTYNDPSWINSLALSKVGLTTSSTFDYDAAANPALKMKYIACTLDFGSNPSSSTSNTFIVPGVTGANSVMVFPDLYWPAGRADEWEMDPLSLSGYCTTDTVKIFAHSLQGPVKGQKTVRFVVF